MEFDFKIVYNVVSLNYSVIECKLYYFFIINIPQIKIVSILLFNYNWIEEVTTEQPKHYLKHFSRKQLYLSKLQNEISISTLKIFHKILKKSKSNDLKLKCLWVLGHLLYDLPIKVLMGPITASTDSYQTMTEEESYKRAVGTIFRSISKAIVGIIKDNKMLKSEEEILLWKEASIWLNNLIFDPLHIDLDITESLIKLLAEIIGNSTFDTLKNNYDYLFTFREPLSTEIH